MKLTRPIAVLDIETTGLDPEKDRIIDLAIVYMAEDIGQVPLEYRFNPGIPISPEATKIHGIRDEDVAPFPSFRAAAVPLAKLLEDVDLAGYHPRLLDLPMLAEEFERADIEWNFEGNIIDVAGIFKKQHPRDLAAAVKFYLGRDHEGAHGALADAIATAQVLRAQMLGQPEAEARSIEEWARFSQFEEIELVDLAGKLGRDASGDVVFMFGKNRGRKVLAHLSYAHWMLGARFPSSTRRAVREELDRLTGRPVKIEEDPATGDLPF